MIEQIKRGLSDKSSQAIAAAIGNLVRAGSIGPGDRLPTVRSLASALGVSPSTISDAWRILQMHGLIHTDRRRGTIVRMGTGSIDGRAWHVPVAPGTLDLDLSTGTPDPALLPSLEKALARVHVDHPVTSYLDHPVIPQLEEKLRSRWPFVPEVLTIVDGAQDALDRIVSTIVHFGDPVLVEDPSFPPLIDMLELAGAKVIGIPLDDEGMLPYRVKEALHHDPVAIFLQPRSHNPTGLDMTPARSQDLAEIFSDRSLVVVEDDHSAEISGGELVSLGPYLDSRVLRIHSFSKSHGPDLRLAAIGGCAAPLNDLIHRRRLGPSWSSRLLQHILLELLSDATAESTIERAVEIYQTRRNRLRSELHSLDIETRAGSGLNLWVPVQRDQLAVVSLAAHGIGVAPGRPFEIESTSQDHIRVTTANLENDFEVVAGRIAEAARQGLGQHRR